MIKKIIIIIFILFLNACNMNDKNIDNINSNNNQEEKTILALWDSLTAWLWVDEENSYPAKLEKKLQNQGYNYNIINAWVSWETSKWLKERIKLYEKPDIVIIVIWWNDWLRWLSTKDLKENIEYIIDYYNSLSWVKIVLWGMDIPQNIWKAYRKSFLDVYKQIWERNDIYYMENFLKDVAWVSKYNQSDQIHPNAAWYDVIVDNLYNFLKVNNILND